MSRSPAGPRVLFDILMGVPGHPRSSRAFYEAHKKEFGQFAEAWIFKPWSDEAALAGFYRADPDAERYKTIRPPDALTPNFVLIDDRGDQIWLSGVATEGADAVDEAEKILEDAGFVINPRGSGIPQHYINRLPQLCQFDHHKWLIEGDRAVHDRCLVKLLDVASEPDNYSWKAEHRWEFERFKEWWRVATEPQGWIDDVSRLVLYGDCNASEREDHYGYQLIARGERGREAWVKFLEPYHQPKDPPWEKAEERRSLRWVNECLEWVFASVGEKRQFVDRRSSFLQMMRPPRKRPDKDVWLS